jgi:predicted secreted Zn-dependent protease
MRILAGLAAWLIASVWLGGAQAEVRVQVAHETYIVEGDNLAAVWQDIARKAPRALRNGLHAQAEARIRYRWTIGYVATGESCAAMRPGVSVNVTILIPEWRQAAAPHQQAAWRRYINAVKAHEDQHRAIAEETGRELHRLLRSAPRHRSCRALARRIEAGVDRIMAEERRRQNRFDRIAPPIRLY